MFGLFATKVIFDKQVKVVDFSALDRIVTVELSNKKTVRADMTVTSPEQFSAQLIQAGLSLYGLTPAIKQYKDYLKLYNDCENADDDIKSNNTHYTETVYKTLGEIFELALHGDEMEKIEKNQRELSLVLRKIVADNKVISSNSSNSNQCKHDNSSRGSDFGDHNPTDEEKLVADNSEKSNEDICCQKLTEIYAKIDSLGNKK